MAEDMTPAKSSGGIGCLKIALLFGGLIVVALIALTILGAVVGGDETAESAGDTGASATSNLAGNVSAEPENSVSLTGPQGNAARSAQQYLSMSGFSRKGLIQQLSSDAGEGYELADATAAVDSLNVDWNEQAVRSAKTYLEMSGFSCKGLVQQLSSGAGEDFTLAEAKYGAQQAGAC